VREEALELFIFFFGGYIFLDSLRLRDKKKNLNPKRKDLFALRFFYLSRGRRQERREG